jgi:hypothetical protein
MAAAKEPAIEADELLPSPRRGGELKDFFKRNVDSEFFL